MARSIGMALENPTPVYRAVVLYLYTGVHHFPIKTYTTEDGTVHQYHEAAAYGPYGTRAPATGQITSAIRTHEDALKHSYYIQRTRGVAQITGFVEEQIPAWKPVPGTERTA